MTKLVSKVTGKHNKLNVDFSVIHGNKNANEAATAVFHHLTGRDFKAYRGDWSLGQTNQPRQYYFICKSRRTYINVLISVLGKAE